VLDSVRTLVVWGASLIIGWEHFQYLQIVGFSLLLLGTAIYNKLIPVPITCGRFTLDHRRIAEREENERLLAESGTTRNGASDKVVALESGQLYHESPPTTSLNRPLLSSNPAGAYGANGGGH